MDSSLSANTHDASITITPDPAPSNPQGSSAPSTEDVYDVQEVPEGYVVNGLWLPAHPSALTVVTKDKNHDFFVYWPWNGVRGYNPSPTGKTSQGTPIPIGPIPEDEQEHPMQYSETVTYRLPHNQVETVYPQSSAPSAPNIRVHCHKEFPMTSSAIITLQSCQPGTDVSLGVVQWRFGPIRTKHEPRTLSYQSAREFLYNTVLPRRSPDASWFESAKD